MTIEAITPVVFGALLGGTIAFFGGYVQRRLVDRRAIRSMIYTTFLRDALSELERYVRRPYESGALEYLRTKRLSATLKAVYRQALVASRSDEFQARSLWHVALDLDDARRRSARDEMPLRVREGGWGKLMFDTVAQAERVLLDYERWLHRRLLMGPHRRQPRNYDRIEIDRDVDEPDVSRFDPPAVLTTTALEHLLGHRPVSWRLRIGSPGPRRVLDVWVSPELAGSTAQRMFETTQHWLAPLGTCPDDVRPHLIVVSATLQLDTCRVEKQRTSILDNNLDPRLRHHVPVVVQAELDVSL
ncbi:hypothetical protein [Microbacterium sp. NPDC057650]|uniref:hypothetical protein n=1 Tax=unclassified Microbacterium TaxID=2609290 RepID=UPI00366FEA38